MHLGPADPLRDLHEGVPVQVLALEEHHLVLQQQLGDEVAEPRVRRVEPVVVHDDSDVRAEPRTSH
ncbi:hypothetical protein Sgou_51660 [Streptomyces gougerotii]|uniref:Uncharacterized protein n=1 Tax=Streptomyces gougerotii TaxID=53448 RepID=A0ABQ1DDL4_9ACTN|nr:hypothetical protein Sgou_51660 [Streptomyces gougerotii]